MQYVSTRGTAPAVSFTDAILAGLAPDGGLYVPQSWPRVATDSAARRDIATAHFTHTAAHILQALAGDDLDGETCARIVGAAYGAGEAWPKSVTPLKQIDAGLYALELFHGPSLSFKDVAMQLIAPLYEWALSKRDKRLTVVCATSGDTGGAAVEALKHSTRVDLFVLLPKGRVSDVQRRFMTASSAANVHALEVDGDFDACQAIVKALFNDHAFADRAQLSGVNSINWARILAQSVYFRIAAETLCAAGPVNFIVPTGNFGDAFSGYVAKRMGAPIGRIMLGVNANDILSRALNDGRYERAAHSYATLSPAMDIQVASNFERLVFEATGRNGETVRALYANFAQSGGFTIPDAALSFMRETFDATSIDDARTRATLKAWAARADRGYLACPHTAVGLAAREAFKVEGMSVCLATAAPEKFPETIEDVTGHHPKLPQRCEDLYTRSEIITPMQNDAHAVKACIMERSRAWRG
jgi:threonine synthase